MEVVPDVTEELGTEIHVIFSVDAPPVVTEDTEAAASLEGEGGLAPLGDGKATFTARVDPRSRVRPKEPIRLAVDPSTLHFFEPATGEAIGTRSPVPASA